jgi:uncharacterized protein YndB with AHSA1/START domain/TfoX/Sxy family transcriptional regulator of competence genes
MAAGETIAEVRRRFKVAPERVFAAFADASMVGRWLSPSPEVNVRVLDLDFREGGTYRFAYHLPGGETVIVGGFHRLIEPPAKIVFSWVIEPPDEHAGIQSEVTVTITPDGEGAELLIHHEKLERVDAIERHAAGWQGALARLVELFELQERSLTATDDLAAKVRAALSGVTAVCEVRMFGGLGFMLNGNMLAAASKRGLLVRVGKERQHDALSRPGTRPLEMRGRVMEGYLYINPPALTDDTVDAWLQLALAFVQTLPPKTSGSKPKRREGKPK